MRINQTDRQRRALMTNQVVTHLLRVKKEANGDGQPRRSWIDWHNGVLQQILGWLFRQQAVLATGSCAIERRRRTFQMKCRRVHVTASTVPRDAILAMSRDKVQT
ncbi:unnamed protein product [Parnassius apollo]|uniref:(apollo) hypothetical protein n=1 Tax=Parnassius apollo TaxID=110799 RepID=A0A8S3WFS2_PARAO|nr:unnamed protein product [Parnassius apollo]